MSSPTPDGAADPRRFERAAGWLPLAVVLVGLLATISSSLTLLRNHDAARTERLTTAANHIASRVDRYVSDVAVTVQAVAGVTAMQGRVLPTDTGLARSVRAVSTGQPATEWLPGVVGLIALEAAEGEDGALGQGAVVDAVTALPADIDLRDAPPIEDPAVVAALGGATRSGTVVTSGRLGDGPLSEAGADVVVVAPLYDSQVGEAASAAVSVRTEAAIGWIVALVDVDALAAHVEASGPVPAVVTIREDGAVLGVADPDGTATAGPSHRVLLPVAGRSWTVEATAAGPLMTGIERAQPWFALGSGLMITAAAAIIAWLLINHRRRAFELVGEATSELSAANERLERSNRELREFAAVVSHDLKSPLTAVRGYLDILPRFLGNKLDDRAAEILGRARGGADHMRALIDDLLDYAAMEDVRLERQPVDLTVVVGDALADLDHDVEKRDAEVDIEVLDTVAGDPRMLRQLATNLLGNALKFVPPTRAPKIRVTSLRVDGHVQVCFDDNGVGVPPEERETVLEAFQRSSRTREFTGTGLGLAIVGRIVDAHGGSIAIEESDLGGARIRVTLPAS